ncbi:MAG: O-antigen ligase family protein [Nitrospirota bacterium]
MKQYSRYFDYCLEANTILLIFAFPHNLYWFNKFWEILLGTWIMKKLLMREGIALPPMSRLLLAFIMTGVLSALYSGGLQNTGPLRYLIKGCALSVVIHDLLSCDQDRAERILNCFVMCTVAVGLYGIYEVLFVKGISFRAQAFFGNTFHLSLWTGIGLFISMVRLDSESSKVNLAIYYVTAAILGAAFLLSKSRGPLLAMGTVLLIVLLNSINKRKMLKTAIIFGVLVAAVFAIDDDLRGRVLSIGDDKTHLRWTIWKQSLMLIKEKFSVINWLIGKGPGLFKYEYPYYDHINQNWTFPHLMPLELFYTFGLLGSILLGLWICKLLGALRCIINPYLRHIALLPFLVLLICFVNESFFSRYFSFPFWFFVGASLALLNNSGNRDDSEAYPKSYHPVETR